MCKAPKKKETHERPVNRKYTMMKLKKKLNIMMILYMCIKRN